MAHIAGDDDEPEWMVEFAKKESRRAIAEKRQEFEARLARIKQEEDRLKRDDRPRKRQVSFPPSPPRFRYAVPRIDLTPVASAWMNQRPNPRSMMTINSFSTSTTVSQMSVSHQLVPRAWMAFLQVHSLSWSGSRDSSRPSNPRRRRMTR